MSTHRVQNILIGDGTAIPAGGLNANPTNIAAGDLAIVGRNAKTLTAGDDVSDTDAIYVFQGNADGTLKRSMIIPARQVTSFTSEPYDAGAREVWSIGANRQSALGSIIVCECSLYELSINFKNSKFLYSERPLTFRLSFESAIAATQLTIATQIAAAINNNVSLATQISAVVIGDGTGVHGLTGATDYGVEVLGLVPPQFSNTSYKEDRVSFEIFLDDTSGFGETDSVQLVAPYNGTGTYTQVYNIENFDYGYEGVLNRSHWPIPTLAYATLAAPIYTTIVPDANATGITIGEDKLTFDVSIAGILKAGDKIRLNATTTFEIKYVISTTVVIVTAVAAATLQSVEVEKLVSYDLINIEFGNATLNDGPGTINNNKQSVVIAVPAGIAGNDYTVSSTQGSEIIAVLNPYFNSVGFASVTL